MRATLSILAAVELFGGQPAHSNVEAYRAAISNVERETVECAAYYAPVSRILKKNPTAQAEAKQSLGASMMLLVRAMDLAQLIQRDGGAINAQFQLSFK